MAIVRNLADTGGSVDRKLFTPNRKLGGSPLNDASPRYVGEIVLDILTGSQWKAQDSTATGWTPYAASVRV